MRLGRGLGHSGLRRPRRVELLEPLPVLGLGEQLTRLLLEVLQPHVLRAVLVHLVRVKG